jgi:UDPglucose 6-dehydrogenase
MIYNVAVIGTGYVGTVAAACLAHIGHTVVGVEVDDRKLLALRSGTAPFYEPGLGELLASGLSASRLSFTDNFASAMDHADIVFICVGTPSGPDGHPDLSAMKTVAQSIARNLTKPHIVVNKSTVPIGTGRWLVSVIEEEFGSPGASELVTVVSNPEFLREGHSVHDFLHPDRIVIGSDDSGALDVLTELYRPILEGQFVTTGTEKDAVPLIRTSLTTAEMTKYASNSFLATKISFANEMARICDMVGADITEVTAGMGLDARIGSKFLDAGMGWGGSCFPKDILALIRTASEYGYKPRILDAALAVNADQRRVVLDALLHHLKTLRGARIGILGLAFKPGTDDLRDSAALDVARMLSDREALVVAHDPMVNIVAGVRTVDDPYDVANGADAIVLATEWPVYLGLDMSELRRRARGDLFFDGRNVFNPVSIRAAGFEYVGIGRGTGTSAKSTILPESIQLA